MATAVSRELEPRVDINAIELQVIRKHDDVFKAAALCMDVFFSDDVTDNHGIFTQPRKLIQQLQLRQLYAKLTTAMRMSLFRPQCIMLQALDGTGQLFGYVEMSLSADLVPGELAAQYGCTPSVAVPDAPIGGSLSPPRKRRAHEANATYANTRAPEAAGMASPKYPKITNLAVTMGARGCGIGRKLVARCVQQAAQWGYRDVLLTVEPGNVGAIEFYKSLGFSVLFSMPGKKYDLGGLMLRQVPHPLVVMRLKFGDGETPGAAMLMSKGPQEEREEEEGCIVNVSGELTL